MFFYRRQCNASSNSELLTFDRRIQGIFHFFANISKRVEVFDSTRFDKIFILSMLWTGFRRREFQ